MPPSPEQPFKVINRQISTVAETGDMSRLFELVHTNLPRMNGINLVTAFHRVAKLASSGSDRDLAAVKRQAVFQELFNVILKHVQGHSLRGAKEQFHDSQDGREMPVQCLSIVAWSCAMLQIRHRSLFAAIADVAAPRLLELKPYELSNLLWAFAKLGLSHGDLFKSVIARLLRRSDSEFKVQCLSTIAWSFATVKRRNLVVFHSFAQELVAHADEMKPQEISNTLWAFAKTSCAHTELFNALGDSAAMHCAAGAFKPQEISNTAWAFATVGIKHPMLFMQLEALSMQRRGGMVPQNVANILWAFAKLQVRPASPNFFPMLLEVSLGQMHQHKAQELSAIIWAASRVSPECHGGFCSVAVRYSMAKMPDFSCNGLANLVKAVSHVPLEEPELLPALLMEAMSRIQHFRPSALAALLHGAATALENTSYVEYYSSIVSTAAALVDNISLRAAEFQAAERRELFARVIPICPPVLGVERLRQALAAAPAPQEETGRKERAMYAGSTAYASTSEDHMDEDDQEECCWPEDDIIRDFPAEEWPGDAAAVTNFAGTEVIGMPTTKQQPCADRFGSDLSTAPSSLDFHGGRDDGSHRGSTSPGSSDSGRYEPGAVAPKLPGWKWTPACADALGVCDDGMPWRVPLPAALDTADAGAPPSLPMSISVSELLTGPAVCGGGKSRNAHLARQLLVAGIAPGALGSQVAACAHSEIPRELPVLDASVLIFHSDLGYLNPMLAHGASVMGVSDACIFMPDNVVCGYGGRVVLKRAPVAQVGMPPTYLAATHKNVLTAVAQTPFDGSICGVVGNFLVYPHCAHGSLADWVACRMYAGGPPTPAEAARMVGQILCGADSLLRSAGADGSASIALSAVQPDEIFIDDDLVPRVRVPLAGRPGGWQDALKWMAPEEAAGYPASADVDHWPALCHRLGLLLYCLGAPECMAPMLDPFPNSPGESVLMGLLEELRGGMPTRPDMSAYRGPEILRRLVAACLRIGGQAPPARAAFAAVLDVVAGSSAPVSVREPQPSGPVEALHSEPMKVFGSLVH